MTNEVCDGFEIAMFNYLTKAKKDGKPMMSEEQAQAFMSYHAAQPCVYCKNPKPDYSGLYVPDEKTAVFQMGVPKTKTRHMWYRVCDKCKDAPDFMNVLEDLVMKDFGGKN